MPGQALIQPFGLSRENFQRLSEQMQQPDEFAVGAKRSRGPTCWNACEGSVAVVVGLTKHYGDKLRVKGTLDSRHNLRSDSVETFCLSDFINHIPQHALRVVALAEKTAVEGIEPGLAAGIGNQRKTTEC